MFYVPLRFLAVGADCLVCSTRVLFIADCETVQSKKLIRQAREAGKFVDARGARGARSIIVLDDDSLVLSSISVMSLFRRLRAEEDYYIANTRKLSAKITDRYKEYADRDGFTLVDADEEHGIEKDLRSEDEKNQAPRKKGKL